MVLLHGHRDPRNLLMSQPLAVLFALAVAAAMIALTEYVVTLEHGSRHDELRKELLSEASQVRANIENQIYTTLNLALGLIIYVATRPEIDDTEFENIARRLLEDAPHVRNIGLARDNRLSHIYPLEGNRAALGFSYRDSSEQWPAVKRAMDSRNIVVAGPVDLVQGGSAFIGRIPVFLDKDRSDYWGIASVVMDEQALYRDSGLYLDSGNDYALRGADALGADGRVFFGDAAIFGHQDSVLLPIKLPEGSWQLAALPRGGWSGGLRETAFYRLAGYSMGLVLGLLVYGLLSSYRRIHHLALHDHLTGLPNRRLLELYIDQYILNARRKDSRFTLLFIDLDGFKQVNDRYGHEKGDQVLIEMACRFRESIRESDLVARTGGDEFIVVLQDTADRSSVEYVLRALQAVVKRPIVLGNNVSVALDASIGISNYPADGVTRDALMLSADHRMYRAKSRP
jgi:diguanylate cyclase (GGDEF)-like protein